MNNKLDDLRHSAAHLLSAAIAELYPEAKRTIGPSIDTGFYYDFDNLDISQRDLLKIEKKMRQIVKGWNSFEKHDLAADEAKAEYPNNAFKHELIDEFSENGKKKVSFYKSGQYWDLCRGGHIDNPAKELQHFKLLSIAGAYWKGDENNPMLTRIYGTAFYSKKDLEEHLEQLEEAKKRDHRKLGVKLDLFTFHKMVGSGLPLYTQKGALIRRLINQHVEEVQVKNGYKQVWTPQIGKAELFKTSGHYDKYKDDMFEVKSHHSEEEFYLKPMNCPHHSLIYDSKPRSYRDLPLRFTDFAMLYRDEKPGELSGLARTRAFSQDDCHIFCREDQVDDEIDQALAMTKEIMGVYGFKYKYRLSTRDPEKPDKYLGESKIWDKTEKWAEEIMKRNKLEYYDAPGEAAFYAPKMDLIATDALGREWQLSTIQIDYVQPKRFGLKYTGQDGQAHMPIIIHRAIIGSAERFLMVLIEHYAGAFPLWLSPVQLMILTISQDHVDYATKLKEELESNGIRVELDDSDRSLGKKIAVAREQKPPYLAIIGNQEAKGNYITLKNRSDEQHTLNLKEAVAKLKEEIANKTHA